MAILSKTGKIHGVGSDPYKWVSGLTQKERDADRKGKIVYIKYRPNHYTQSGFKICKYTYGRWGHREPTNAELRKIRGG